MDNKERFYVLYGSQTGNAESISKEVADKLARLGKNVEFHSLNSFKGKTFEENQQIVLFILCSTTGNGDCPENADLWWRSVKLRSASKDLYKGIKYAVLGLGDTNYDKFCFMGKAIDKRIGELGGIRICPLVCADEATNLEEYVENWKSQIYSISMSIFHPGSSDSNLISSLASQTLTPDKDKSNESHLVQNTDGKINSHENCEMQMNDILLKRFTTIPSNLSQLEDIAISLNLWEDICNFETLNPSAKLSKHSSKTISILTGESLIISKSRTSEEIWAFDNPFEAKISSARWLTDCEASQEAIFENDSIWGAQKRVVLCTLDIKGSSINYMPGDSIGIKCPNPQYIIDIVWNRLIQSDKTLTLDTKVSITQSGNQTFITIKEFLQYGLDLVGLPKRSAVTTLAECCQILEEKKRLLYLAGKTANSKLLWARFIENQSIGLGELLYFFPSCSPSLAQLFDLASALPPRYYSVASSPLKCPNTISIAFSLVRNQFKCGTQVVNRSGLCTSYLEYLLRFWLYPKVYCSNKDYTPVISIFHKSSPSFHLPNGVNIPLILIGPGTGVAPFMSFLEHRSQLSLERRHSGGEVISTGVWRGCFDLEGEDLPCESNKVKHYIHSVPPGDIHLFFGCRNGHDFLFADAIKEFLEEHTLTSFEIAMSRVELDRGYVTDKLLSRSKDIADMLLNQNASVYICGDGNKMAKDVQETLSKLLSEQGGLSLEDAKEYLIQMRIRRKLLLDVWS